MYQRIMRYKHDGVVHDGDIILFECVDGLLLAIVKDRSLYHYAIELDTGKAFFDGKIPSYHGLYFPTQFEINAITALYEKFKERRALYEKEKRIYSMRHIYYLVWALIAFSFGLGASYCIDYFLLGGMFSLLTYLAIVICFAMYMYRHKKTK